jgi:hypothetical protein
MVLFPVISVVSKHSKCLDILFLFSSFCNHTEPFCDTMQELLPLSLPVQVAMGGTFHLKASIADLSAKDMTDWNTNTRAVGQHSMWEVEFQGRSNRWITKGQAGDKV